MRRDFPRQMARHLASPDSYSPRRQGRYAPEDLAGFVDGVFAIAATLLVLDLRLPDHRPGGLGHALGEHPSQYLSYALGFLLVLVGWINCRRLLRCLDSTDHYLTVMITVTFGAWTLTPFTVSTLASASGNAADLASAARLMAAVITFTMVVWAGIWAYAHRRRMLKPATGASGLTVYRAASQTIWLLTAAAFAVSYASAYAAIAGIVLYGIVSLTPYELEGDTGTQPEGQDTTS